MSDKILVTYATKYGGTAEIAAKICQVLQQTGLPAEVLPVKRVKDLSAYKAVILGSAVYIGQWRKEAGAFLKANEAALAERPVWLYSSGPTGEGDPVALSQNWRFPKGLQPIADRIHPRGITIFHGVVDPKKLNSLERWMLTNVQAPSGDFRDWNAITSWAAAVAEALKEEK